MSDTPAPRERTPDDDWADLFAGRPAAAADPPDQQHDMRRRDACAAARITASAAATLSETPVGQFTTRTA